LPRKVNWSFAPSFAPFSILKMTIIASSPRHFLIAYSVVLSSLGGTFPLDTGTPNISIYGSLFPQWLNYALSITSYNSSCGDLAASSVC
jgi:hypothetical protein